MNIHKLVMIFMIITILFPIAEANAEDSVFDLTNPMTLLATCTIEDDGYIGFRAAETEVEKVFAKGRYERSIMGCVNFIRGVSATVSYMGNSDFCLPSISLDDMRAVVVVALKQKYKSTNNSVPIIIEALTKNWPCKS